jgi:uncharacterized protein (DUF1697 family)
MAAARRQTYVALLRAINLGSRNKVPMPALRELFEELGGEEPETYLQSGNVVYRCPSSAKAASEAAIERAIEKQFGHTIRVLLRTAAQLRKVAADNPFAAGPDDSRALHVTFLVDTPKRALVSALDPQAFAPDEFRVIRREVYLNCPGGYGRSKLNNAYFEKALGVAGTTRNWRTTTALAELAAARR